MIIDPNREWVYDGMRSFSKTKSDKGIYQGMQFRGKVEKTLVRGEIVYNDGEITAEPGYGKLVVRR